MVCVPDILQSMRRIAEESIPRSAENIGLAVGALCRVRVSICWYGLSYASFAMEVTFFHHTCVNNYLLCTETVLTNLLTVQIVFNRFG